MKSASRRHLVVGVLVAVVCAAPASAQSLIRFCTSGGVNLSFQPAYFAYTSGLLEFYGLSAERVDFVDDATAFHAFLRGTCHIVFATAETGFAAIANGEDVKMVMSSTPWTDHVLVAGPDVGTFADLAGRTVAVSGIGQLDHLVAAHAFEAEGIDPATVTFEVVPGGSTARTRAVSEGQVAAAVVNSIPAARVMLGAPDLHIVSNVGAAFAERYVATGVYARQELIDSNYDLVQAAVTSVIEATRSLMEYDTAVESTAETGLNPDVVMAVYDNLLSIDPPYFGVNGGIDPQAVESTVALLLEMGRLDRPLTYEEIVDPTFIEGALEELGEF